jgi:Resolvase, N terminal domain
VLEQQVDTHTTTDCLLFGRLSVIAQFELELRAERQRESIAKAKWAEARAVALGERWSRFFCRTRWLDRTRKRERGTRGCGKQAAERLG